MTAYDSLSPLIENPVPKGPTLIESLSFSSNQIKPKSTMDQSSFTEIFGEFYFKEKSSSGMNSPEKEMNKQTEATADNHTKEHGSSMDFLLSTPKIKNQQLGSSGVSLPGIPRKMNSTESFQLCTEGPGYESSDDVKDSKSELGKNLDGVGKEEEEIRERKCPIGNLRVPNSRGDMPPPISCIGSCGKPWILFESIKKDGRFILREIKIPTTLFLHASRKDGRLKLHLVRLDDAINHEEEEDDDKHQDSGEGDMHDREEQEKYQEQGKENS